MYKSSTSSKLASFATLKSLSEAKKYKSPYQILSEFIRYIIIVDSMHCFYAIEMKNRLNEHFCFSIPEAVVKKTLKNMDGISYNGETYNVLMAELGATSLFEEKKKEADDYELYVIRLLSEYISTKLGNNVDEKILTKELVYFLTDDLSHCSPQYSDLIGEFVLKNEQDGCLQNGLNRIREGSILYMGLSHNICEIGSIKKPLALYLGTEILFSLVGYNGSIYKQFAEDFYEQVRVANSGKEKRIKLFYFSETKKEIDEFFGTASELVEGKRKSFLDKPAMKAITDGKKSEADIEIEKSDFYYKLQYGYGIIEDRHDNYYGEVYFSTNLENFEYDDEAEKNKKKEISLKIISHINKLRNGNRYTNDIDAEHLIITNTKITLYISKEQTDIIKESENMESVCNFAVSLDRITCLLWYKLGNGFAKMSYPSNVEAIKKARVVLSSSIAKNAERVYSEAKQQCEAGVITEDQVAARIISLRNKANLPENLKGDNIDEIMDFSPEYLNRYEEQFQSTKKSLKEKEKVIEELKSETNRMLSKEAEAKRVLSEKDETIALQNNTISEKDNENAMLRGKIAEYERKEAESVRKKEKWTNISKFVWSIVWKLVAVGCVSAIALLLENKCDSKLPIYFSSIVSAGGLIYTIWSAVKRDADKYLKNHTGLQ